MPAEIEYTEDEAREIVRLWSQKYHCGCSKKNPCKPCKQDNADIRTIRLGAAKRAGY